MLFYFPVALKLQVVSPLALGGQDLLLSLAYGLRTEQGNRTPACTILSGVQDEGSPDVHGKRQSKLPSLGEQ